ncbi:tetratricopeptide repeat protein [Luteimonas yindakuii]|uniref:Ancillary SecYEG translocon subunit n=1 Tax=Luteimonas yindakuii TaxID=2565782 RepID=A0A4Z1RGX1_9GAMM|nr:tetratricopeptide repeat protein [Luteimonas yindakuii]TKS53927.1 tetratricopeptide repeat protein [Luteimonas yindakuii]
MAIDDLPDEHEQGERVRTWLRENGLGILAGIVVAFGLVGGWRWWQGNQHAQRVEAGMTYQRMVADLASGDLADAQRQVGALQGGSYGVLAALELARAQVQAGERDAAIQTLQGADASDLALEPIRRQRLGQLLIDAARAEEAVALLRDASDATSLETLGDAHAALDQTAEAREAYARALAQTDVASPGRGLIEIKLAAAGGEPTPNEAS